jgi:hypothetical protein
MNNLTYSQKVKREIKRKAIKEIKEQMFLSDEQKKQIIEEIKNG